MKKIFIWAIIIIVVGIGAFILVTDRGSSGPASDDGEVSIANPASVYCVQQGGSLDIRKRGDGGEYGACVFEDNRQCEEWAMVRGNCPLGGIKITGYDTDAQRYCAISGGKTIAQEDADCTFDDGTVCSNTALFNGTCQPSHTGPATGIRLIPDNTDHPKLAVALDDEFSWDDRSSQFVYPSTSQDPLMFTGTEYTAKLTGLDKSQLTEAKASFSKIYGTDLMSSGWVNNELVLGDITFLPKNLTADGVLGSNRSYAKKDGMAVRIIMALQETTITDSGQEGPIQITCPCDLALQLFVSDVMKLESEESEGVSRAVSYQCSDEKSIDAIFYTIRAVQPIYPENPDEPPTPNGRVELSLSDGRSLALPQTISASGIRYANNDESIVFWSKGKGAFLTENGVETYSDCTE